MLYEVNILIA